MLGYITLGTNDLDAASRFYDSLFVEINVDQPGLQASTSGHIFTKRGWS